MFVNFFKLNIFKEKLRKKDYEEFIPQIEGMMHNGPKIRLIVELLDFEGWTAAALWEDTKFAARHFGDIERLAVVGDARWPSSSLYCGILSH